MAAAKVVTIECGFCLRKKETLTDPKSLPCTHVHCLECLMGYFEENNMIVCPVSECGEMFEGSPDTLPSHDVVGGDNQWCDFHDEGLGNHKKISMKEYEAEAMDKHPQNCTKHEEQPYIMGCTLCTALACVKCISHQDKCDNGASHNLLSLDDLVAALVDEDICAELMAKEDQYEKLFKETSKTRADYDIKTTEMIELIRHTRDAQVSALNLKYQKLEDEVMQKRRKSSVDMAEFMEDVVLTKWTQLRNQRRLIECRLKRRDQVDVVKGYKMWKEEIQKSVVEELPKLQLRDELQLKKFNENQLVELEIVPSNDIVIDIEQEVATLLPLPKSVELLKTVKLSSHPYTICRYKGSTYIGLDNNTVCRIDSNYQLYNTFITTSGPVESVFIYKDRFYTLSRSNPRTVSVFDVSGGHITSWNHPYHENDCSMLTVVADEVVIADPTSESITVYSLTGESLRQIHCPQLSNYNINMCAADNTSVVVSDWYNCKVFRVNLPTGDVMWTYSGVECPLGLICYGDYILLAAYNSSKTLYILDTTTGSIVSEVAVEALGGSVFGLGVYGTTLVVTKYDDEQALFYQLKVD